MRKSKVTKMEIFVLIVIIVCIGLGAYPLYKFFTGLDSIEWTSRENFADKSARSNK